MKNPGFSSAQTEKACTNTTLDFSCALEISTAEEICDRSTLHFWNTRKVAFSLKFCLFVMGRSAVVT